MPNKHDNDALDSEEDLGPSKSERKRQMHALQALGESLLTLSERELARIPIEDEQLLSAVLECRRIRSNSARKRHLQLIGKRMRVIDAAPIESALSQIHQMHQEESAAFHSLEKMRDDMLAEGPAGVELAIARWPEADRQPLRQLLLQHQRETARNKPPAASRKLFRHLRGLQEHYGDGDTD
jgi:ribosome-associated protein